MPGAHCEVSPNQTRPLTGDLSLLNESPWVMLWNSAAVLFEGENVAASA
jgi:hypothetical protein